MKATISLLLKISLSCGGIQEHKNTQGGRNKTDQIDDEVGLLEALSKQNIKA